jgi:hypothetical protein
MRCGSSGELHHALPWRASILSDEENLQNLLTINLQLSNAR